MSSRIQDCVKKGLITPPNWLPDNICYETIMGSTVYGCAIDDSDMDIYGFCIPKKEMIFPHLTGAINGFDRVERFDHYQQHQITDDSALGGKGRTYDFTVYSIVRYFRLLTDNNPNIIDSLFTPEDCVQHCTQIGHMVREKRHIFLHKGVYDTMKAYAYSQIHKMDSKEREGKRKKIYDQYGWDIKFGYHLLRLIDECEQLLESGDLDLRRNREQLKACRRGEISQDEVKAIFAQKSRHLEELSHKTALPEKPRIDEIKQLLLNCLEQHYGKLADSIVRPDVTTSALREIIKIAEGAL